MRHIAISLSLLASALLSFGAEKYTGPLPPKSDIPYLVHADTLIETEAGDAREETRKVRGLGVCWLR